MGRNEWMAFAKKRALAYCDQGNCTDAYSSIASDLNSHPETQGHPAIELGMRLLLMGELSNPQAMRKFIEGFN